MDHSAIAGIIAFVLKNFTVVLLVIALVSAVIDRRRPGHFLAWLLLLPIGVGGLWSGFFHIAYPEVAARFIGWQDSPFQFGSEWPILPLALPVASPSGSVTASEPQRCWSMRSSCWETPRATCIR